MARTLGVTVFPAALITLVWLRLEERPVVGADWLWCALLALAPALAPKLWLRLALIVPAALVAAWVALDTPSTDTRPGFFEPVLLRLDDGFFDYYDVQVPFNGVEQPHMHGVLALAIFGFCLLLGQFVAARRPLPAVLTVIAGAGWPATLYPVESVALRRCDPRRRALGARGLRACAAGARPACRGGARAGCRRRLDVGCGRERRRARLGALGPERDGPAGVGQLRLGRELRRDRVPEAEDDRPAHHRAQARASTGARRRSTSSPTTAGSRIRRRSRPACRRAGCPSDPLLPASLAESAHLDQAAGRGGLAQRLAHRRGDAAGLAASAPARRRLPPLRRDRARLRRPRAGPALHGLQLCAPSRSLPSSPLSAPAYPPALDRFLQIGRTRVEPFGAAGRDERVDALFGDERYLALWPYEGLWNAGPAAPGGRADAVRRRGRDRDLAPLDGRVRLRRVTAADPAACRRSRTSWPRASAATASTSPARWR